MPQESYRGNNFDTRKPAEIAEIENNSHDKISRNYEFDEAIELAGTGLFQNMILIVCGVAYTAFTLENSSMTFVVPAAKCDLNITMREQGFINSIGFLGVIVSSNFWGILIDTWGRKKVLLLSICAMFFTSFISSFSVVTWMLITTRLSAGICGAGVVSASITYLSEFCTKTSRSKYLSFMGAFASFGTVVQSLLALTVLRLDFQYEWFTLFVWKSWRQFIITGSMLSGLVALFVIFLPESPKYVLARGDDRETLRILQSVYKLNTKLPVETYPVQSIKALASSTSNLMDIGSVKDAFQIVWKQTWPLFAPPYLIKTFLLCTLLFFLFAVSQGMQTWNPQILIYYTDYINDPYTLCEAVFIANSNLLNTTASSSDLRNNGSDTLECGSTNPLPYYVMFLCGISFMILGVLVGCTLKRFHSFAIIPTIILISGICSTALIWSNLFYANVILMIFSAFALIVATLVCSITGNYFPVQFRGMAISLMLLSGRVGSVVGSSVIGTMLIDNCNPMFGGIAGILLGSSIASYCILRKLHAENVDKC